MAPLLDGVDTLRALNATGTRKVPAAAPLGFVRPVWAPYVRSEGGFDRKFYELCVMAELKTALRAGDIWVPGSRQFRDFDEYLIERAAFTAQAETAATGLAVATDAGSYLEERLATLHRELTLTNRLARQGQLPDVELTDKGLKIKPLDDAVPAAAERLIREANALLPHVKCRSKSWTEQCHESCGWAADRVNVGAGFAQQANPRHDLPNCVLRPIRRIAILLPG